MRWTFEDPDTSTTYTFAVSPNEDSPVYQKGIQTNVTPNPTGMPLVSENSDEVTAFSVRGILLSQTQYQQLEYFYGLRHPILCTDDLGRQRTIYLTQFQPVRTPNAVYPWKHTYTLSGYSLSETLP